MIKMNEFTNKQYQLIIKTLKMKEVQVMYNIGIREQNSIMCCRMLISRACEMAGAFGYNPKRFKTMRH